MKNSCLIKLEVSVCISHSLLLQSQVVDIRTASLKFNKSTFCPHSVFMCFVWIWEQTAIISLYSTNWLVCIYLYICYVYIYIYLYILNLIYKSCVPFNIPVLIHTVNFTFNAFSFIVNIGQFKTWRFGISPSYTVGILYFFIRWPKNFETLLLHLFNMARAPLHFTYCQGLFNTNFSVSDFRTPCIQC